MKFAFTLILLLLLGIASAQTFTELNQGPVFNDIGGDRLAVADLNGDGHLDVAMIGTGTGTSSGIYLFINDGTGVFSKMDDTPFGEISTGAIALSDVDGDDDQDLLIAGETGERERITKLYLNDGTGMYGESTETNFEGVLASDIAFVDVESDGDSDVIISGTLTPSLGISSFLYVNDGAGNFSKSTDVSFTAIRNGSIDVADVDDDGDQDVLIVGEDDSFEDIAHLYINDGAGNFSLADATHLKGVHYGDVRFADFDGDGHHDVLITGINHDSGLTTKLYFNDGAGAFPDVDSTSLISVHYSSVDVADVDDDGDLDILIAGMTDTNESITKLYTNDAAGNFSEVAGSPFIDSRSARVAFGDINNDNRPDVLVTGLYPEAGILYGMLKVYLNEATTSTNGSPDLSTNFRAFPNPVSRGEVTIVLQLADAGLVNVKLYTSAGNLVGTQSAYMMSGEHPLTVDTEPLSAGSYFIRVNDGRWSATKKIIVK